MAEKPKHVAARPSITDGREGAIVRVRVTPRSRREEIVLEQGEEIRVRLKALPEEGRANKALLRLLARALDVPTADVEIASGWSSRRKTIRVRNLVAREVEARLRRAAAGD